MSAHELEEERDRLQEKMMASDNCAEIEWLGMEIEAINDVLDEFDPLADE